MSRKKLFKDDVVVSCRFESECYRRLKDIAALETIYSGAQISALDLIRYAVDYVYTDNDRLRDAVMKMRKYTRNKW